MALYALTRAFALFTLLAEMVAYHPSKRGVKRKRAVVKPPRRPQLTQKEKGKVEAWLEEGVSKTEIARRLNRRRK